MKRYTFGYIRAKTKLRLRDNLFPATKIRIRLGDCTYFFSRKIGELLFFEKTGSGFVRPLERGSRVFVERVLKPGDIFFDIGANSGLFTLLASPIVGLGGHVYAFEPAPTEFAKLTDNVGLNRLQNVTMVDAAVSDAKRTGTFWSVPGYHATLSSLRKPVEKEAREITVQEITLDCC